MRYSDPITKKLARKAYRLGCGISVAANIFIPKNNNLAVYYGGARQGDIGGPLVKVKRLREHFPQNNWGYNLVYVLSNTPYLSKSSLALLKHRKIPIVHNQNGVFYKAWYEGDGIKENDRMALSYHAADWVFYQSKFCKHAAQLFLGPRSGSGEVLYNAIDTKKFFPREPKHSLVKRDFVFLLTGKIDSHLYYRLESTIKGLRMANKNGLRSRLKIAGWVERDIQLRAMDLSKKYGIANKVEFLGPYTQKEAPSIYRAADAYVMTKHNDPCPNTVLEAMSCGLPVLYSNSGGVPELVGDDAGIGLLCEQSWDSPFVPSAQSIGDGMIEIVERRKKFSTVARQRAIDLFDISDWIDRHKNIFERLLMESK